ncbi:hypothetical protein CDL15_Pgr000754 [Punica granatum]|uniref:Uncharacterized protein n=1 Tax=Punica granatum TaxID=22663 RepID=A0A218W5C6_PUNGR|nr:hypothetical protein CDL15_Pgr000754 [Punica granatum]
MGNGGEPTQLRALPFGPQPLEREKQGKRGGPPDPSRASFDPSGEVVELGEAKALAFPLRAAREDGDENYRIIGEVLTRKSGRNPLTIEMCSKGVLERFLDDVNNGKQGILLAILVGLSSIPIEMEIFEFASGEGGKGMAEAKMEVQ